MSSRVLRGVEAAGCQAPRWRREAEKPERGWLAFHPRRLDPRGEWLDGRVEPVILEPPDPGTADEPDSAPAVDVEAIRREAFQLGSAEGENRGAQQARAELQGHVTELAKSVHSLATQKSKLKAEAEREVVALALAVARKVVRRELTTDPQTVLAIVRACLEEHSRVEIRRLRINPKDAPLIEEYLAAHPVPQLQVEADRSLSPGSAIFETNQGEIDARVETQLKEIENGLADL